VLSVVFLLGAGPGVKVAIAALCIALFFWVFYEAMVNEYRRRFLASQGVDWHACVVVYCGYLFACELVISSKSWYFMYWLPANWRQVTPSGNVSAEYRNWLHGLTVRCDGDCKPRQFVVEPLGRKNARLVVRRLLEVCPDAGVRGIETGKVGLRG
jgi:hypothetical protein